MTQAEIEKELAEKIETNLNDAGIEPEKGSKVNYHQIQMRLTAGKGPEVLYFLADVVARKTKKGKLKWNLYKPLCDLENAEAYIEI